MMEAFFAKYDHDLAGADKKHARFLSAAAVCGIVASAGFILYYSVLAFMELSYELSVLGENAAGAQLFAAMLLIVRLLQTVFQTPLLMCVFLLRTPVKRTASAVRLIVIIMGALAILDAGNRLLLTEDVVVSFQLVLSVLTDAALAAVALLYMASGTKRTANYALIAASGVLVLVSLVNMAYDIARPITVSELETLVRVATLLRLPNIALGIMTALLSLPKMRERFLIPPVKKLSRSDVRDIYGE